MPAETGNGSLAVNSDLHEEAAKHPSQINNENKVPNDALPEFQASRIGLSVLNGGEASHKTTTSKQTSVIDTTKDLWALVAQQMRATPNAIALEDETTKLTYSELDQRVAVLANLLRDHGVGRDNLVGVLLGRSANYVIACLAALRAGGAFLVLEL